MSSKNIYRFYIYAYIRSKNSKTAKAGTPYYIGKGQGDRAWRSHGHLNLPNDKSLILILESNLSEIGALALERRYIKWYGRKVNNTGILHNISEGGQSSAGTTSWNNGKVHSSQTKDKISKTKTGVKLGKCYNNGDINILLKDTDSIPPGFILGKLLSNKQLQSMESAFKKRCAPESRKKAANTMKKENRPADFVHGNTGKTRTMWISNLELNISKQVKFTDIIPNGWVRGRKFQSPNRKKREVGKKMWIHNVLTNERTMIDKNSPLPDGWQKGSNVQQSPESNASRREYGMDRRWITNIETEVEIMISKSEPLPEGWKEGSDKTINRKDPITGKFKSSPS